MKTKTYKLEDLVKKGEYYYSNPALTTKNYPVPKTIRTEGYKVIKMGKSFTAQEALSEIQKKGCTPANVYELALLKINHPEIFEKGIATLAFGSTDFVDADGRHRVPRVRATSLGDFYFYLGYFERSWGGDSCLLCFCDDKTLNLSTLENSKSLDSLTLHEMIEEVKKAGYQVSKIM